MHFLFWNWILFGKFVNYDFITRVIPKIQLDTQTS